MKHYIIAGNVIQVGDKTYDLNKPEEKQAYIARFKPSITGIVGTTCTYCYDGEVHNIPSTSYHHFVSSTLKNDIIKSFGCAVYDTNDSSVKCGVVWLNKNIRERISECDSDKACLDVIAKLRKDVSKPVKQTLMFGTALPTFDTATGTVMGIKLIFVI